MAKLSEIAKVCKSKNAGPFEVTIDIMFETREMYDPNFLRGSTT